MALGECIDLLLAGTERRIACYALEAAGKLARHRGDAGQALLFWGAARAARARAGIPLPPGEARALTTQLESTLVEGDRADLERGEQLELEQALGLARELTVQPG